MNDARMMNSFTNSEGEQNLEEGCLQGFLNAVGNPHDKIWDERISNLEIQVDNNLAQAWMNFSFYLGGNLSHCGVNAMQFIRTGGIWKIIYLIDTRRKHNCIE